MVLDSLQQQTILIGKRRGKYVATKTKVTRKTATASKTRNTFFKTLFSIGGYFKGAWLELRQVRWPTRRATWELTLAVILFSAFFIVIILLLDLLFKYIFELILT